MDGMTHLSKFVVALSLFVMPERSPELPASRPTAQPSGLTTLQASDRDAGVALLKRATVQNTGGQYAQAVVLYDSAALLLPQIKDWISVFAAASLAQLGDTAAVAQRLALANDTLAAQWGWRAGVRAYDKAGAPARAIEIATAATTNGTASKRAEAWYRIAELQRDRHNPAAQRAALFSTIREAPESDAAGDAARELAALKDLSSTEQVLVARTLMRTGEVASGVRAMEAALKTGKIPATDRSQIHYELGRVLFTAGKYADAVRHLKEVTGTTLRADARYLRARSSYRLNKTAEGKQTLEKLVADFRTTPAATRALFLLGDLAHDDGELDDALKLFERAAAAPAKTEETAVALMRIGDIAFVRADFNKAADIFDASAKRYPNGSLHDQAVFWSAMSNAKAGRDTIADRQLKELRRTSPLSYYAMRAAAIQGASPLEQTDTTSQTADESVRSRLQPGLDRWQLLRDVGWDQAASFELARFRRSVGQNRAAMYALAEELNTRGAPHLGIAVGRELLSGGAPWDRRMLKIMYPMPYLGLIERNARAQGLDPFFVAGVIRQESRFNPRAVSGAGAVGLMQVMPRTGNQIHRAANGANSAAAVLTDPEVNIKLGTKFLADLSRIYGTRNDAILVAYNAGPTRADRWRAFPEFETEDLFVERIPFTETRDYVKAVKLNAAIYRALYGDAESTD